MGNKHFKIGLFPRISERGVVMGIFSATAEKGGLALSLGGARTKDEEIQEGIHEAKSPWYRRVNICGGLLWNKQTAGEHKINIALPTILASLQTVGDR
ncbi:MAG: hypothetical protein LBG59_00800 [Candidatus Peribacteria bacterium]|nr:hypothetical protein [Candidatus Peribacteria bacterium]